ncbi:MAG: hypothetical protein WBE72_14310 [Terracidiphilus sp.]
MPFVFAVACFALLIPRHAGAESMNAQATDHSAVGSSANPAAAQQEAAQMVSASAHLVKTLDARKAQAGTQFEAIMDGTVHLKNGTELPHGTLLIGTVATDQMRHGGASRLALRFTQAKLRDGKTVPIHAMIAGIAAPADELGYTQSDDGPPSWSRQTLRVDEIGVESDVDLHSGIAGANSGVLVSTKKDDVKLAAGSRLSLAIAEKNNGNRNATSGGA